MRLQTLLTICLSLVTFTMVNAAPLVQRMEISPRAPLEPLDFYDTKNPTWEQKAQELKSWAKDIQEVEVMVSKKTLTMDKDEQAKFVHLKSSYEREKARVDSKLGAAKEQKGTGSVKKRP
ncbi:hypothetical protein C8J56DRAFT_1061921 [Mycena floridula]|nr:hypothetical protein C8J56DRAFT_1061921 [Mycena floridula]